MRRDPGACVLGLVVGGIAGLWVVFDRPDALDGFLLGMGFLAVDVISADLEQFPAKVICVCRLRR